MEKCHLGGQPSMYLLGRMQAEPYCFDIVSSICSVNSFLGIGNRTTSLLFCLTMSHDHQHVLLPGNKALNTHPLIITSQKITFDKMSLSRSFTPTSLASRFRMLIQCQQQTGAGAQRPYTHVRPLCTRTAEIWKKLFLIF